MSSQETATSSQDQKRRLGLMMKLMAAFDFVLAAAIVVFGPAYVGGDPSTDMFIRLGGVGLAVVAAVIFWIGQRFAAGAKENDNDGIVQRRPNRFAD